MFRNMVTSLIYHERIMTTLPKAKELRRVAEKVITLGKKGELHHRQLVGGILREKAAVSKLFEIIAPRYSDRPGGYTRVMKLMRQRRGDSANMAYIELVDRQGELRPARQPTVDIDKLVREQLEKLTIAEKKAEAIPAATTKVAAAAAPKKAAPRAAVKK
jgi:large subunit ribosomal protein L17